MHRLVFPFPFMPECDFEASNRFAAEEVRHDPASGALMLVHPAMTEEHVEAEIDRHGFLGLKPYRFYSATGDTDECRVTDFLPEHQIAVADRRGLLIMLHLSKRAAIADPENIEDVRRLCEKYPDARWILAHCAGATRPGRSRRRRRDWPGCRTSGTKRRPCASPTRSRPSWPPPAPIA